MWAGRLDVVGQDGLGGGRAVWWPLARASLRVRLVAAVLCLLAAGAAVITGACGLMARGYLMGQADQQLRAYADRLISRPFVATPISRSAPAALSAGGSSGGALSIEVRGSGGELVLRQGRGARPGQAIPAVSAAVAARAGQLVTIAAGSGGGSWRVIAEPIHYEARRIPFGYDAEDFYVFVTSTARPGLAGTLVIGLDLASIGQAIGRLAVTGLAVSGVVVLVIACLGAVVVRAILRPLAQAEQTLAAVAAGELSRRVPERHGGSDADRLAWSVNKMLSQIEHGLSTRAESEAAARRSGERMCCIIADTGRQLRRPLSIIHGFAGACRRSRLSAGELDHMMKRVADEAARMDALVDDLLLTRHDQPPPPQR
jgi:two-component system OmpR family sensor kinase